MIDADSQHSTSPANPSATNFWRAAAPVAVLIVLSPVLTELLAGIVTISRLWLLIPEMAVYGGAALMIREVTRRQGRGWGTILLLGVAFAVLEECVILQTSLTPQFFPAGTDSFGWAFGVQWSYFVAMLGYESVYAIVLPIALTEILFPARRNEPWLSLRGLAITAVIFALASVGVWWLWSHVGVARYSGAVTISPLNVILGAVIALMLAGGTLALRRNPRPSAGAARPGRRRAWWPWMLWLIAFIFGLFWWILVVLAYLPANVASGGSLLVPIIFGAVWGLLAYVTIRWLSGATNWQDRHRLALIFGASVASMLAGTLSVLAGGPIDLIGKLALDLVAIVLFAVLAWRLRGGRAD
ncbi:MAG TPA: hypothetical protein VH349_09755 [Ktedonobacterales bacterium]